MLAYKRTPCAQPTGCCFFFGGLRFSEQSFNALANKTSTSLLFMACLGVTIPTASHQLYSHHVMTENDNLQLSRLVALVLALVYCCYLFFQLKTHAHAFSTDVRGDWLPAALRCAMPRSSCVLKHTNTIYWQHWLRLCAMHPPMMCMTFRRRVRSHL